MLVNLLYWSKRDSECGHQFCVHLSKYRLRKGTEGRRVFGLFRVALSFASSTGCPAGVAPCKEGARMGELLAGALMVDRTFEVPGETNSLSISMQFGCERGESLLDIAICVGKDPACPDAAFPSGADLTSAGAGVDWFGKLGAAQRQLLTWATVWTGCVPSSKPSSRSSIPADGLTKSHIKMVSS